MGRVISILAALYRRWKYVEDAHDVPAARRPLSERERLEAEAARGREMILHFRRHGCEELASAREASLRALERKLKLLG